MAAPCPPCHTMFSNVAWWTMTVIHSSGTPKPGEKAELGAEGTPQVHQAEKELPNLLPTPKRPWLRTRDPMQSWEATAAHQGEKPETLWRSSIVFYFLLEAGAAAPALSDNWHGLVCDFAGINWETNLWPREGLHECNHLICHWVSQLLKRSRTSGT